MSAKKKTPRTKASGNAAGAARSPGGGSAKVKAAKGPKAARPAKPTRPKRTGALDAAAAILADASKPMSARDLITEMEAKKLWKSPGGKTPEATLSAAVGREIAASGGQSRFKKVDRGLFAARETKLV